MDVPEKGTGIPISILLDKIGKSAKGMERHKFHPGATLKNKKPGEEADLDSGYIKNIEHEFSEAAENILENLNLMHLLTKPKKKD